MKKIITLICCFGLFGSAFAQTGRDRAGDVILGGGNTGQGYPSTTQYPVGTQQQDEINAINREFDTKVASVQANNTLSAAEKDRIIRQLNAERARRIREVNRRYDQNGAAGNDKKKVKKNGKDNGNHYGWEKGKGNPHRDANWQKNKGKKAKS
jgi:hypothetical protein